MANQSTPWYLRTSSRWKILRSVPMSRLWALLMGAFLLFSVNGYYTDLMHGGTIPYAVV